ncbi:RNA-binding S4 domain-containing protein [Paracoccaceae bacterium]
MAGPGSRQNPGGQPKLRLDKWLFQARFFKTREASAEVAGGGSLRLNGQHCLKAAHGVAVGDVLTFPQGGQIRVIRVTALGVRRGPVDEAQKLYDDLDPPATATPSALE